MKFATAQKRFAAKPSNKTAADLLTALADAAAMVDGIVDDDVLFDTLADIRNWLTRPEAEEERLTAVQRLSRDLALASISLTDIEARFLVDSYYIMQDNRIRADGQVRSIEKSGSKEPHLMLSWFSQQADTLEDQVKRALDKYSANHPDGEWLRGVVGIGPVLAAGLLAHLNIEGVETVGHWWAFAGYDPNRKWEKGQKRPHNADLKKLCWKVGQSFMKNQNREGCVYGVHYRERKDYEIARNDRGANSERAVQILKDRKFRKDTDAYAWYTQGKLPPAHIDAQARRWVVKLFLAHLHEKMYTRVHGKAPPLPYPIAHLGHVDVIKP